MNEPTNLGQSEARLIEILRELVEPEDEPCRFDHHGYCQAHGWFGDEPGECGIREARELLGLNDEALDRGQNA